MLSEQDLSPEQRIEQLEQELQLSQRRNTRIGYLMAAILAGLVLFSWLQMIRTNRLYDLLITRDIATARPPLASPAWHRQAP